MMQDVSDIGSPMAEPARRPRNGWGLAVASALLHLSLLAVFLLPLPPIAPQEPQEETVSVEIVPPAEEPAGEEEATPPPPAAPPVAAENPPATAEEQAPPPPATMIAAPPPPPDDAPERADQSGETAPKADEAALIEAAPVVPEQPAEDKPAAPDVAEIPGAPPADPQPDATTAPPPPDRAADVNQKPQDQKPEEPQPEDQKPEEQAMPLPDDVTPPEADLAAGPASGEPAAPLADAVQAVPVPMPRPVQPAPASEPSTRPGGAMEKADTLLSAARLENPALRSALGQLSPNRRLTQICSFEVAEQVSRARPETPADFVVPYGPSGGFIRNGTLDADGGAYRSGGRWFDVSFRCTVDMKTMRVTAFSYRLGKEVPPQEWPRRRLPGA
jgi:hypothetical protein